GDAKIAVVPAVVRGVPGLKLQGSALAGRLAITGSVGTAAPDPVALTITGTRIEVDPFLDLRALLKQDDAISAWASGTVTVRTELAPVKPIEPEAWIELTELSAQIDHRGSDGRITPLAIRIKDQNRSQRAAMSLHVTPSSLAFSCRDAKAPTGRAECSTILETPAGDIVISGQATEQAVAIAAHGDLDLGHLAGLFDQQFSAVAGHVRVTASVAGALAKPTFEAAIDLDPDQRWQRNEAEREARDEAKRTGIQRKEVDDLPIATPVMLQPSGSDTVLTAPRGLIKLARGSVGFTDVLVQIRDDRNAADEGDLHVAGNIELDGFTPANWSVLLSGKLAGKMLQLVAPNLVSQANGLITIDVPLQLTGRGPRPALSGALAFDHFAIVPRGSRREISLNEGSVDIATVTAGDHQVYTFNLADINGTLDDGQLSNISGSLTLRDRELTRARIQLDATGIPFRIPQTLNLVVTANNVELAFDGAGSNWKVTGVVTVVDGAYLRDFELTDRIQTIGVNSAPSRPFWEEYPTLGNAELRLTLIVQLFAVDNNIATIEFRSDSMQITGTPRDPRLSGGIRVTHGEFRIPGTRARFMRTSGTVDFAENQPAASPDLHVTSDADYRDLSGQEHVISVSIAGTLQLPTWDLKTSTGYNKSQTLSLLVLGRNQEQLRRSLGDQTLGGDPTRADPTTNPSQGFADQIVKDLAGDWVSDLLGSSLTKLTGLDVLRIEIGFGSIGFHIEKKILENAKILGDAEQTIRGTTIKARAELKTPFVIVRGGEKVSLQGGYLNQNYYDPAEQDIEDFNLKLVYRVFIP
ncbi:MAG: translocation/assembly module TamB domain-containing protein, partial [Myxococcales bacterium]|nr:translocation/assembly module TamB domain-containing protein [Myxococcales bacterium]